MVMTWADYDRPELHGGYAGKHGGSPEFVFVESEDEALKKLAAGLRPDVMHPCAYDLRRWREAGLLRPLDERLLPNLADVWDRLKAIPQTVYRGQRWFAPFDCGHASVLYRTDLVDPADVEEESWALLFDDAYAGRLAMYDAGPELVATAALALGYGAGASLDDDQLDRVRLLLSRQRVLLRFYWREAEEMEHALASGEIVASYAWNDSALRVAAMGVPVRFMEPREGRLAWVCGLVRHAAAPGDEVAAHDFINAMLAPEAGQFLIETYSVGHANRKAFARVDPELLAELGWADAAASFRHCMVLEEPEEPLRSRYLDLVARMKAGLD
ncbi:MAG: extracellular solute-binding protein [Rhodospirillaceae bacterium]|nr:extracellular solute-binding protein [Rhodospirillaceae bacterium]